MKIKRTRYLLPVLLVVYVIFLNACTKKEPQLGESALAAMASEMGGPGGAEIAGWFIQGY